GGGGCGVGGLPSSPSPPLSGCVLPGWKPAPGFRRCAEGVGVMSLFAPSHWWSRLRLLGRDGSPLSPRVRTRRALLFAAGVAICVYAVAVLLSARSMPDPGLRRAFSTRLRGPPRPRPGGTGLTLRRGDVIPRFGDDLVVTTWPALLAAPPLLPRRLQSGADGGDPPWLK